MIKRLVATFSRQVQTNKRDEKYHQFIFTCAFVCHPPLWQETASVESGHAASEWTRFQNWALPVLVLSFAWDSNYV